MKSTQYFTGELRGYSLAIIGSWFFGYFEDSLVPDCLIIAITVWAMPSRSPNPNKKQRFVNSTIPEYKVDQYKVIMERQKYNHSDLTRDSLCGTIQVLLRLPLLMKVFVVSQPVLILEEMCLWLFRLPNCMHKKQKECLPYCLTCSMNLLSR